MKEQNEFNELKDVAELHPDKLKVEVNVADHRQTMFQSKNVAHPDQYATKEEAIARQLAPVGEEEKNMKVENVKLENEQLPQPEGAIEAVAAQSGHQNIEHDLVPNLLEAVPAPGNHKEASPVIEHPQSSPEHECQEQQNEVRCTSPSKEEFKISFDKSSNKSDSSSDDVDIITHQDDIESDNRDQIGSSSMSSVRSAKRSNRKAMAEMELYSQEMVLGTPNMDISLE